MAARGRGAIVNIIGAGGKTRVPVHLPGGSANAALMLATVGTRRRVRPEGRARQRHQSGRHADRRVQEGLPAESRMTGLAAAELLEQQQARIPLRRLGTPEEVAEVALFLASDARELRHRRDRADGRRRSAR